MFFALTEDQQEFGAAVRGYLAERFDLAAVRGVVEDVVNDPGDDGNPATLWKAAGEQGGSPSPCPRSSTGWARTGRGPGHRAGAGRRGRAGPVARHRARG
jgi:hypothetical protein